tara:strand:+ start:162 stop:638 length:477 start_codon:yes stop_codon:yes gene_type:complete
MPIKSFRGKLATTVSGSSRTGSQNTISLHTNNGSTGYRIVKFDIMSANPGAGTGEHIVKIFTIEQTTVSGTIDFSDQTLLAAATLKTNSSTGNPETIQQVIFDNMKFNQDIYITAIDINDSNTINYYIELEQIKLDLNQNTVATLKDIRNIKAGSESI